MTPSRHPIILIFTGQSGEKYGYRDHWKDGVFFYSGEGQRGNMRFIKGNLAIREHVANGKDLHLFEIGKKKGDPVRYVGQMVCTGYEWTQVSDQDGKTRRTIVFELVPLELQKNALMRNCRESNRQIERSIHSLTYVNVHTRQSRKMTTLLPQKIANGESTNGVET